MSLPGFGAEQSLRPSSVTYNHATVTGGGVRGGYVSPQFLDFIVEAVEKIVDSFSKLATAAAEAIKKAFEKGGRDATDDCKSIVGLFIRCPPPGVVEITGYCGIWSKGDVRKFGLCTALAPHIETLAKEYCSGGGKNKDSYVKQACGG